MFLSSIDKIACSGYKNDFITFFDELFWDKIMNAVKPIILALNPISSEIGEIDYANKSVTGSLIHRTPVSIPTWSCILSIINEIIVSIEYVKGIIIILFDNVPSKFILSLIALFRLSFSFTIISNSNDK